MYEDGPTGSIEALKLCWLFLHRGVIGSISVCAVLQEGHVHYHECHKQLQRDLGHEARSEERSAEMNSDGNIA